MVTEASKWHVDVSVVVMMPSAPYTALVTAAYIAFSRVTYLAGTGTYIGNVYVSF
jgi:hypothetical protein